MRAAASWQAGRLVLTALLLWRVATALRRRRRHCALDAARRLRGGHAATRRAVRPMTSAYMAAHLVRVRLRVQLAHAEG